MREGEKKAFRVGGREALTLKERGVKEGGRKEGRREEERKGGGEKGRRVQWGDNTRREKKMDGKEGEKTDPLLPLPIP